MMLYARFKPAFGTGLRTTKMLRPQRRIFCALEVLSILQGISYWAGASVHDYTGAFGHRVFLSSLRHIFLPSSRRRDAAWAPPVYSCKMYGRKPVFLLIDLRHTFASMLYDAGVDPKTAQRLLGHASIETTLKIYVHLQSMREQTSVEQMTTYAAKFNAPVNTPILPPHSPKSTGK